VPQPLLIADIPWLLYRAFFSLPKSIKGSDGEPVNALLGTVNAILSLIDGAPAERIPRAVAACMGAEQAAYRVELYPPYHAHRDPMPPELAAQWRRAPDLLRSLGWTYTDSAELEADDVMFSYARAEEAAGGRALLLTGDRDLYGAVTEHASVVELRKGAQVGLIGPAQVRERYGIEPELVPDLIALRGDPSDGIPGAPGIGAKTAAELLRAHGSLSAVIAAAQAPLPDRSLKPRTVTVLRENAAELRDFELIATLQRVPVKRPKDAPTDFDSGARVAEQMGMRRLAERLRKLAATA
jgi:DNA polymerase-1